MEQARRNYNGGMQDKGYENRLQARQAFVDNRCMTGDDLLLLARTRQMVRDGRARDVREGSDLSQHEVGQAVGVTAAAVSRWECGQRLPRTGAALRYARLLEAIAKARAGAVP
jgi:DNA-binding transcriptional regulator YiaG